MELLVTLMVLNVLVLGCWPAQPAPPWREGSDDGPHEALFTYWLAGARETS